MRLLLDENLSPRVARMVQLGGHDSAHVAEVGLGNTDDAEILSAAAGQGRAIVTADRDSARCWRLVGPRRRRL